MDRKNRKYLIAFIIVAIITALLIIFGSNADAAEGDEPCTEVVTVVDEEAWTEIIEHPAVTEVIHHDAVTETTPAIWANWAPNDTRGPQDYVPNWPVDNPGGQPRGVWIIHDNFPPGHEGPDGVYQQGAGNSPWFYRQAEKVTVISEAYDETVVVEEAWTETVEHAEVSHEETVEVDCPDEPEEPEEPPVDEPKDPKDPKDPPVTNTSSQTTQCLGGALVTKTTDANGNISTSTENGSPQCKQVDQAGEPFQEEGM